MDGVTTREFRSASNPYEKRYCIVDVNTGEVLDDAQGYGYRTQQKAYAAYAYKTRDRSKDKERQAKRQHIKSWMKKHKEFMNLLEGIELEIAKGSGDPDDRLDAKLIKSLWKEQDLNPDFTASEFLKVYLR